MTEIPASNKSRDHGRGNYTPQQNKPIAEKTRSAWSLSFSQRSLFRRQTAKMVVCRVILLDQENFQVELAKNALGKVLFDNVKQKLNLEEADYFGLSWRNSQNLRFWLNNDKRIDKQVESTKDMVFYWEVKFYPPAPEQLNEDLTRYLVVLQIRQDLFNGRLPASFHTLAILGCYTSQGEIGDYDRSLHDGLDPIEYLRPYSFAPKQSEELLTRICDLHKTCKGLTPAEADLYFLENAKKCAMYGVDMFTVKDSNNREVKIGVSASGLYVYQGRLRLETFKWPRMLKISYKTNIFHIKVRPAEYEHHLKTLGFKLPSGKLAKRLWRIAVENHQFFRLNQPEMTDTSTIRSFGSRRWRMSGRTQAQLRNIGTPRKSFSRANSIGSTDTFPGLHHSSGTMPVPASRHRDRDQEPDYNKNYNTYNDVKRVLAPSVSRQGSISIPSEGRPLPRGTDKLVDVSHDDSGEYIPEGLDESSMSRDPSSMRRAPTSNTEEFDPANQENLVNGSYGRPNGSTDMLPGNDSAGRMPNGAQYRRPVPMQRSIDGLDRVPTTNGYDPRAPDELSPHSPTEEAMISSAGAPLQQHSRYPPVATERSKPRTPSQSSKQPTPRPSTSSEPSQDPNNFYPPTPTGRYPTTPTEKYPTTPTERQPTSPRNKAQPTTPTGRYQPTTPGGNDQPTSPTDRQQPTSPPTKPQTTSRPGSTSYPQPSKFGVGELPMPRFSLESAGIMPSGGLDNAIKLSMSERAEKVIKVGVPPTVKTTGMRFDGDSAEPNTRSTWSPPTVKTEKRHFNFTPNSRNDPNGYPTPVERISETTTYTTERDGYIEKKVKHTITLSGDDTIDDQLLLDAIQAVTGLDQTLGVDRIEIKTEEECS